MGAGSFDLSSFVINSKTGPVGDAPMVDTAEQVYISSLALLKVNRNLLSGTLREIFSSKILDREDVETWSRWCAHGGHGSHAGRVHRRLYGPGYRCVCYATVGNGMLNAF
jgi:hypothetical protein